MRPTGVVAAWRSRWWVLAACGLVGLVVGIGLAIARTPVYSSSAVVSIGPASAASSSENTTAAGLASDYAALATTTPVVRRVAAQMHTDSVYVSANLSAAAEVGTPLISVTGTGATAASARNLALRGAQSLIHYAATQSGSASAGAGLLKSYAKATATAQRLQSRLTKLQNQGAPAGQVNTADVAYAVAQLKAQGLSAAYTASTQAAGNGTQAQPQLMTAPGGASSDRSKKTGEFAIVGLILGLCLGAGLITVATAGSGLTPRNSAARDATAGS